MKKIETVIKPFKLDELKNILGGAGVRALMVTEVNTFGRQKAQTRVFRGSEYKVDFLPEIKIELIVPDDRLEVAIAAIVKVAKPSGPEEDNIFVSNIEPAFRVHTASMAELAA